MPRPQGSQTLLDAYRRGEEIDAASCPLQRALLSHCVSDRSAG